MGELLSEIFGKLNVVTFTVNEDQYCECQRSLPATEEQLLQQGWDCEEVDARDPSVLGEGGSSVVFKRELRICPPQCTIRNNPMICAVKRLTGGLAGTVQTTLRMAREAQVMDALAKFTEMHNSARGIPPPEYQYILPFYGSYVQKHSIYIAMQYMPHGDLEHYISEPWDENDVRVVTEQLLWGLKFMHENSIAHRDIKPANIFPSFTDGRLSIKIGDFGSAKSTDLHGAELCTIIGTHDYMAPEVYGNRHQAYTVKVDSWSVGCMVYRLLRGKDLFMSYRDVCRYDPLTSPTRIKDGLPGCSVAAVNFLMSLIQPEEECRASPQQSLNHPWLNCQNPKGFGNRTITPNLARRSHAIIQAGIKPHRSLPSLSSSCMGTA